MGFLLDVGERPLRKIPECLVVPKGSNGLTGWLEELLDSSIVAQG